MKVFETLSGVMDMVTPTVNYHDERIRVRHALNADRHTHMPNYVVVSPTHHMCVINQYMPAMYLGDSTGSVVYAVWRDANCDWHVAIQ